MEWYLKVLKQYVDFSGRARRKEYWMFTLVSVIISIVFAIIDSALFDSPSVLGGIYSLAILLPSIAVSIRRLHDTSRSGWWILINLIPLIGAIVFFVFLVSDSTPGSNEWGPNPKEKGMA